MPWTITPSLSPAIRAAASATWIGLRSPVTMAKGRMLAGAVTLACARKERAVSTIASAAVGAGAGASPRRPWMAKRSVRVARPAISAVISTTRPTMVSVTASTRAVIASSASVGSGACSSMRCSR